MAGYGQVAEIVGIAAQTVATAYQIYLQRLMAKTAQHNLEREQAAAAAQVAAQQAAQVRAAQVVSQQASLMATGGVAPTGMPKWVLPVGLGVVGIGAMLVLGRRRA